MKKEITAQWWWSKKDREFTLEEVAELLEQVKVFNAGAIDKYLTRHVDKVFDKWLADKGVVKKK
jgi:hypothetical protein